MQSLRSGLTILSLPLLLAVILYAGSPGSFRGKIVEGPHAQRNWIYIEGRNGMLRRVEISHAQIGYDDSVVTARRLPKPQDALITGAEVRVTAEQDSDGEWKAAEVDILRAAGSQ
jgi:hypothetical protein